MFAMKNIKPLNIYYLPNVSSDIETLVKIQKDSEGRMKQRVNAIINEEISEYGIKSLSKRDITERKQTYAQ